MIKDNKQRLFEMMNRVGGMPLINEVSDSDIPALRKNVKDIYMLQHK
jgi:hypothetical protein